MKKNLLMNIKALFSHSFFFIIFFFLEKSRGSNSLWLILKIDLFFKTSSLQKSFKFELWKKLNTKVPKYKCHLAITFWSTKQVKKMKCS